MEKGIDIVLQAAKELEDVAFHVYGPIDDKYYLNFYRTLIETKNVFYHGVFIDGEYELYSELEKFDIVLLPTRWKAEGVPGILVESKIAGIPAIVTDICYNAEIVTHGVDGLVIPVDNVQCLVDSLKCVDDNTLLLENLKRGARESGNDYFVDKYINEILRKLI